MYFKSERLLYRDLIPEDKDAFYKMMCNPNVMNPIPRDPMSEDESNVHFEMLLHKEQSKDKTVFALVKSSDDSFIGIAAFLKNNVGENEIGYRLLEEYWGVGYGTETAESLLKYGFESLNFNILTADVFIENNKSVKILDKLLNRREKFFNQSDNCMDRRYELSKEDWLKRQV